MGLTIKDIAIKSNTSPSTVSRVLNNSGYVSAKTRKRVEEVINANDYVPSVLAQSLTKGVNDVVGVVVPEIDNPFFFMMMKGINEVADAKGMNIILCDSEENVEKEDRILKTLRNQRIRGLIAAPAAEKDKQDEAYVKRFQNLGIPVVLVDRELVNGAFDGVFFDDTKAIYDITTLLLNEGHRHIEILAGTKGLMLGENRIMGYKMAYVTKGLEFREEWIHYGKFTKEDGYEAMKRILEREKEDRPTAVIANNNMLTLGALKGIFEKGLKIPGDMAFAGYDRNETLEMLQLNITLSEKDNIEMGKTAMRMLWEHIEGEVERPPQKIIMQPKLVIRGSEKLVK